MTDTYAAGFLDGWKEAAETLRTRFHLTARDAATGARIDAERLGDRIGHSDLPEGKPWLVGPQEPLRVPTFVPHVWDKSTGGNGLMVAGACMHCGWAMP